MKKIIHSCVRENTDNYKWSELNCFYKIFGIALNAIDDKYFNSFVMYVASYILYGIKGEGYLSFDANDCILKYYNSELAHIFGSDIVKENFTSHRNMIKKVYNTLLNNKIVVIPCDLYYLPYSKSYLELHKRHYMIIKGIDIEKGVAYILDNMHIELGASTRYKDFMIDTKVLYEMVESFRKGFDNINISNYFWSIELNRNVDFDKDNKDYLEKLCKNILEGSNYLELDIANNFIEDNYAIDMNKFLSYSNLRIVFLTSLQQYIQDASVKEMIKNTLAEWKNIKLHLSIAYGKDRINLRTLVNKINDNISNEKHIMLHIIQRLRELTSNRDKGNSYLEFEVRNRQNAQMHICNNSVDIILDEDTVYDIWNNCEDGVIVITNKMKNRIDVTLDIETEFGSSSHCGIYIELSDGSRILFGSLGRLNMAVHMIDDSSEYEKCIYQEILEGKGHISIEYDEKYCMFYSGNKKECEYRMELPYKIAKTGVFAKTWQNCYCRIRMEL